MNQPLTPECEVHSYRLEIRDEAGELIRVASYDRATRTTTIEHADGTKEVIEDAA